MVPPTDRKLLGFLDLDLGGNKEVRVPVRAAHPLDDDDATGDPIVSLVCHGSSCEILVRGDANSPEVNDGMQDVAEQALRHLSRKLLN